jgi:hypothetical protein
MPGNREKLNQVFYGQLRVRRRTTTVQSASQAERILWERFVPGIGPGQAYG